MLASLLGEWIEHQREASGEQSDPAPGASGMGRLLFERRRKDAFWLGLVAAVPCGLIGTFVLFDGKAVAVGVGMLAAAAAALVSGVVFDRQRFRCYELGLARRRIRDEVRLLYDEIAEFTYSAVPTFYKGAISGPA